MTDGRKALSALLFAWALCLPVGAQVDANLFSMPAILKKSKKAADLERQIQNEPGLPNDAPVDETRYLLGPGDDLYVYLGSSERITVSPEGYVQMPGLPPVNVAGKALSDAKKILKSMLARQYDTSKVYITLAGLNQFKVQVLGEVEKPGARPVNSFTRVSEAIKMAGGFTRFSRRASVLVLRPAGDTVRVNLSAYFRGHRDEDNPFVNIGEKIVVEGVDFSRPLCSIRKGEEIDYHQMDEPATVKEIFAQINDYELSAPPPRCRILEAGGGVRLLDSRDILEHRPAEGDTLEFFSETDHVFVGGAVAKPHVYEFVPGFLASDYLYLAGVLPHSAKSSGFTVLRGGEVYGPNEIARTGIRPGDKIYLQRSRMEGFKEFLGIIAPLAGIIISSVTLYYTFNASNSQ